MRRDCERSSYGTYPPFVPPKEYAEVEALNALWDEQSKHRY